ncbi:hypothetical protein MYX76_18765, partial [Desulfobacterota bacterium AH_259_B03_O07]|nr:hypothetical protein [Desulfobacterota bacterium AH_259_B03_O07]
CVVRREENCIFKDAEMFLPEIDQITSKIEENASLIEPTPKFPCRICGVGNYVTMENGIEDTAKNLGLNPAGQGHSLNFYCCDNCGNVQIFDFQGSNIPPLWKED